MAHQLRKLYVDLLKKSLLDDIYGHQKAINDKGIVVCEANKDAVLNGHYWPDRAHTMIGTKRMDNIQFCVETCIRESIPGDFIETGVWRGGATIFMRGLLEAYSIPDRLVYVADSFEGLPAIDPQYPVDVAVGLNFKDMVPLSVSLDAVKENFRRYDLLDERVVFIKGFFETSLVNVKSEKLAILRLDGDMYSSTVQVLDQLYKKVSPGGFIIIDDWCLAGARQAVIDFRNKRSIKSPMTDIDDISAYWRN